MAETSSKKSNKTPLIQKKRIRSLLLLAGISLFLLANFQLLERRRATTSPANLPDTQTIVTTDTDTPEEAKPTSTDYRVAADQPRQITLPTIAASGFIQKVGINAKNAIAVPSNIHFGGWYTESALPGKPGLSIIVGHVSGRYADGIFKDLGKLKAGDIFTVEFGDLRTRNYEVIETKILPVAESAAYLLAKRDDITEQLNLVTCGGDFNKSTQTYNDRVIVVSRAVN